MSKADKTKMKGDELASQQKGVLVFKGQDGVKASELRLSPRDMKWWCDVKFGMFIHWGLYAIPARGEWHMHVDKVPADQYARLADEFVPKHFDADEWVKVAQDAGMRYMVLTARHHDGFALWDSPSSYGNYCSTKTVAKRDFVAEYAKACHKAKMRTGLYYSPMDWRFPGYFKPKEMPDNIALMKKQGYGQVEELMKNYGKIDVLWYDGGWLAHTGTDADAAWFWEPVKLNTMVRKYQPKVVISPRSGWEGDFRTDEGSHTVKGRIVPVPWEKCLNLNKVSWGFNTVQQVMSFDEIILMLVNVVGRGGNVLLNVGPDRDGVIPPAHVERLREVGRWMDTFGKTIYGTRPGPFQPVEDRYSSTHKGTSVFVHVVGWAEGETLALPPLDARVKSCSLLSGPKLSCVQTEKGIEVTVPRGLRQTPCTVLELKLDRAAGTLQPVSRD